MLTPEYLSRINEATQEKVSEVNTYLIARIARQITATFENNGTVELIPSSIYNARKLLNAGVVYSDVQAEIEKQLPAIQKEVRQAFYDAAEKIAKDNHATTRNILKIEQENGNLINVEIPKFEKNVLKSNMTPKEIRLLESAYKRTTGEIYNITRTSASQAQKVFIQACDTAYFKATSGVSINKAIIESVEELAKNGIATVQYAGREDSIETAIARAVRTGVNQANGDITLTRCAESGASCVLVSQHIGARVTNTNDYKDHSMWQGQVYFLDWSKPELSNYMPTAQEISENKERFSYLDNIKTIAQGKVDKKYKDFIDVCGYGKILGICGINCRHSFGLFYPGININTNEQLSDTKNAEIAELHKKQRSMESTTRNTKRRKYALEESGLEGKELKDKLSEVNNLLKRQNSRYKQFCEENKPKGIKPLYWRLKVAKVEGIDNK